MVSVTQKARWCQKFLERIEKAWRKGDKHAVARISGYCRVPVKTAYDWQYKWDGTWQSLVPKSHCPHRHPKAHTEAEIGMIIAAARIMPIASPIMVFMVVASLKFGYSGILPLALFTSSVP
jgi:hypothetical protein